jgi:hypothetical protein
VQVDGRGRALGEARPDGCRRNLQCTWGNRDSISLACSTTDALNLQCTWGNRDSISLDGSTTHFLYKTFSCKEQVLTNPFLVKNKSLQNLFF